MLKSVPMAETPVLDPETAEDGQETTDMTAGVDPAAPWGWTTDPVTKERRPKKAPGRPRNQPTAEELAAKPPIEREGDRAPERPAGYKPPPAEPTVVPMPRGGVIAKGVNKLYRRAGKMIRAVDDDIGEAFIYCTRVDTEVAEDERELTVGEAWEQLARSNPRIRAFVLRIIAGGDVGDLVMAHAPIGVALFMKPWIQRFINPERLIESMTEADEEEEEGTAAAGLTGEDVKDMQELAMRQARQMARRAGVHVTEAEVQAAAAKAVQMGVAGDGLPAGLRRQQPKKQTRAQRAGAR